MTSWAKPGVKCVCIANGFIGTRKVNEPKLQVVYTLRTVEPYVDKIGVRLVEISNPTSKWHDRLGNSRIWEPCFPVEWFRPLITKTQEQDIAMFLGLLQKQDEPA